MENKFLSTSKKILLNPFFKIVDLIVFVISFWWFLENYDKEPLIASIVTFTALVLSFITDNNKITELSYEIEELKKGEKIKLEQFKKEELDNEHKNEVDRRTFQKFLEILPTDGSISFINQHHMGSSFELSELTNLRNFNYEFQKTDNYFLNNDLQENIKELILKIREYLQTIGLKTFPTHNRGFNSVPSEWELTQPDEFWEAVNGLNDMAGEIVNLHQNFIRTARSKLNI